MISKRFKVALAVAAVGVVGGVVAVGPVVRRQADRYAARYGATVTIESVVPSWSGLSLRGIDIRIADVPAAHGHLDRVEVSLVRRPWRVEVVGGSLSALGERSEVLRQTRAWLLRVRDLGPRGNSTEGARRELEVRGLRLTWQDAAAQPGEALALEGLQISRPAHEVQLGATSASWVSGGIRVGVTQLNMVAAHGVDGYHLRVLHTEGMEAELRAPSSDDKVGAQEGAAHPPSAEPHRPVVLYRGVMLALARELDNLLDPAAEVQLERVHARVGRGDEVLNLGPGRLTVSRSAGRLAIELSPQISDATEPHGRLAKAPFPGEPHGGHEETLTFHLLVPLQNDAEEVVADISGGPIGLGTLGVHEGDVGLFDVTQTSLSTRARIALMPDGKTLRVQGEGKVHRLSLRSGALSDEAVAGLELAFRAKGDVDLEATHARVDEGEVDLGAIHVSFSGVYDRTEVLPKTDARHRAEGERVTTDRRNAGRHSRHVATREQRLPTPPEGELDASSAPTRHSHQHHLRGVFDLPLTACQAMLDSTPVGLVPKLRGIRLAGSFALKGRVDIDTAHLDRDFRLDWDVSNTCRLLEVPPSIHVNRFKSAFRRTVYDPRGRPTEIEAGPGTSSWVPLSGISKFMEAAVFTTEDGGFLRHHGFEPEAIRNSVRENLRKRKFLRGASTISMQLAKNLYLDRGKSLSRKLQEAVLTMYLEQELTKEQILELYLNVVEFGPMVYGIGPAAQHYFEATAGELSLGQALYLASIMPNPKVQHFGEGGAVTPRWMSYLRQLMKIAFDKQRISAEELDEGLRETVVRGVRAPPRSTAPVRPFAEEDAEPQIPLENYDE